MNILDAYLTGWRAALTHTDTLNAWATIVGLVVIPLAYLAAIVLAASAGAALARR